MPWKHWSAERLGVVLAVLAALGFSFKAIFVKLAYAAAPVDAVTLLSLRMVFSLPAFLWVGFAASRSAPPLTRNDWGMLGALGLLGYYGASILDFLGLQYISAALERLILFTYPTLTVLIGVLFMGKSLARLGEQTIAAQLWIVGGRKASIYKVAYHEHFSAYSPGTLLTAHLMQHVIESDKVEEVDYLIGDDEYKRRWMSDRRERWGIVAYNPASLLGFALLIKEVGGRALKPTYRRMRAFCRRVWTRISGPGPKEDG